MSDQFTATLDTTSTTGAMGNPSYFVLVYNNEGAWKSAATIEASSAETAIRIHCKTLDEPGGVYVAVPSRSWRPVTVKAETTTVLKLETA